MNQPELDFDSRYAALRSADAQSQNLDRVSSRIESAVLDFMAAHDGCQFYGKQLYDHVSDVVGHVAPDSPRRILSLLQSQGKAHYKVINRAKSLFFAGRGCDIRGNARADQASDSVVPQRDEEVRHAG
jgi:hypothetical protein